MDDVRWLEGDEQQTRRLIGVVTQLPSALHRQFERDAGLSQFEYSVLSVLSETPTRSLRLSHLAVDAARGAAAGAGSGKTLTRGGGAGDAPGRFPTAAAPRKADDPTDDTGASGAADPEQST